MNVCVIGKVAIKKTVVWPLTKFIGSPYYMFSSPKFCVFCGKKGIFYAQICNMCHCYRDKIFSDTYSLLIMYMRLIIPFELIQQIVHTMILEYILPYKKSSQNTELTYYEAC